MRYVFLLNVFTLKKELHNIIKRIDNYCKNRCYNYIIEVNSENYSTENILNKYNNSKDIIIPIGGDGIINRTLNSIVNTNNILGFVPYGTGNDFYKSVKKQFYNGFNNCDIIKVNNKYFLNVLCFGIDADIANSKNIFSSRFIPKKYKYIMGIIYNFFKYKNKHFEIKINGKIIKDEFITIAVCNGCYYGGGFYISPNSKLNNKTMDVFLVPKTNKLSMIKLILSMKKGKHLSSKKISVFETDRLQIRAKNKCNANIDGEEISFKIFDIKIIESGISVYYNQELIDAIID